jgi:hypothetical protein
VAGKGACSSRVRQLLWGTWWLASHPGMHRYSFLTSVAGNRERCGTRRCAVRSSVLSCVMNGAILHVLC